jgi:hypothetical protein
MVVIQLCLALRSGFAEQGRHLLHSFHIQMSNTIGPTSSGPSRALVLGGGQPWLPPPTRRPGMATAQQADVQETTRPSIEGRILTLFSEK